MARIKLKELSAAFISVEPANKDWHAIWGAQYEEQAEDHHVEDPTFSEVGTCDECGRTAVVTADQESCLDVQCCGWYDPLDGCDCPDKHGPGGEGGDCRGTIYASGPQMNYGYPIEGDASELARAVANLPLCVVVMGEDTYLALTGGGMDLSWEICEAYVRCGFLPPVHFADLPGMAGMGWTARTRLIVGAVRRSIQVRRRQLTWRAECLRGVVAQLKADSEVADRVPGQDDDGERWDPESGTYKR